MHSSLARALPSLFPSNKWLQPDTPGYMEPAAVMGKCFRRAVPGEGFFQEPPCSLVVGPWLVDWFSSLEGLTVD